MWEARQHELYGLGGQGGLMSALQALSLDLNEPVYRDCSPPDLRAVNTEPVVSRPGTISR